MNGLRLNRCKILLVLFLLLVGIGKADAIIVVNLSSLESSKLTVDNYNKYGIQLIGANVPTKVIVKGSMRFKSYNGTINYTANYTLLPGANSLDNLSSSPDWQFSSSGLKELFLIYKSMPAGSCEYCIQVYPIGTQGELLPLAAEDCAYFSNDEGFLINLIAPDNKAKITEYNPMLSWIANYSFSSELTFRLRIAEMKLSQTPLVAIQRNPLVYENKQIFSNSEVYPVYAKSLKPNQPYAWTVDAYYKGILLGGAETWKFTIIDDSVYNGPLGNRSYLDLSRENGSEVQYAVGELKLKYNVTKVKVDTLAISILDGPSDDAVEVYRKNYPLIYGDNRLIVNLYETMKFKHKGHYVVKASSKITGEQINMPMLYINPDFVK